MITSLTDPSSPDARETAPDASPTAGLSTLARLGALQSRFPIVQLVVLVVVFFYGAARIDGFASGPAIRANLIIAALLAFSALGQTFVVLLGGLDFAVPGYITVSAVMAVQLSGHHWPLIAIALLAVAVCGLCGAVCGAVCYFFQAQPLVVTLGMYSILVSAALIMTAADFGGAPSEALSSWTSTSTETFGLAVPPVVVMAVVVAIVVAVVLARTPAGRKLYATGANLRAAQTILINTKLVWVITFAISAALTGLSGLLIAGFSSGATASTGDPYLFSGLAAVLVGGTALGSARGDFTRTVLGALILSFLTTILAGFGFDEGATRILYGIAIVLVVVAYGRERRLRDRL